MVEYQTLSWGNCFSYGESNTIDFDKTSILQLVGKNGHGKSSIALILEECLFNKNSKGVKKQHILNRYGTGKSYWINLKFKRDGIRYEVKTTRGSTQTVALYKEGENISAHTATQTFKDIENLVGYDHKTFSQIVYQSSTSSLEFLTATDSNRKKFLIDLLDLSRYATAQEVIKTAASSVSKELTVWETKVTSTGSWLAKYAGKDLSKRDLVPVPEKDDSLYNRRAEIQNALKNIDSESRIIQQNIEYKKMLDSVAIYPLPNDVPDKASIRNADARIAQIDAEIKHSKSQILKLQTTKDKCPTCGQSLGVDRDHLIKEQELLEASIVELLAEKEPLSTQSIVGRKALALQARYEEAQAEYEKYHSLYNPSLPSSLPDVAQLKAQLSDVHACIVANEKEITEAIQANTATAAHNNTVDTILAQIAEFEAEREEASHKLSGLVKTSGSYAVLSKAFSTTGVVAYKIECMIKDLEKLTNEYLAEMADGRFQLKFEISQSDKLNVVITDNGVDIDIAALSTGERARVNVATLLAIRRLMQGLSNTKTNLLILDETTSNLDQEGNERLVEILLNEPDLNTVLVSHSFTHPLIDRVYVTKVDNISRIET